MGFEDWYYREVLRGSRGGQFQLENYAGPEADAHLDSPPLRLLLVDDEYGRPPESASGGPDVDRFCKEFLALENSASPVEHGVPVLVFYTDSFTLEKEILARPEQYDFDGILQDLKEDGMLEDLKNEGKLQDPRENYQLPGEKNLGQLRMSGVRPHTGVLVVTKHGGPEVFERCKAGLPHRFAIPKTFRGSRPCRDYAEIKDFFRFAMLRRELRTSPIAEELGRFVGNGTLAKVAEFLRKLRLDSEPGERLPVVVLGDTGTGKEHLARLIHAQDRVKPLKKGIRQYVVDFDKSFVPVLVSAIGQGVMEGEIFGIKNLQGNPPVNGYIRDAQTGTLFFDELADIPIGIQGKLLRFLQNQEVRPIGGEWEKVEDVRVVFATHSEERLHDRSRFREDFVQRIDGLAFRLPPLSERAQEHQLLIDHFFARELKRQERVLKRSEKGGVAIGRERLPDDLAPMLEDLIAPEVNARLLQMCADGDFTGNVRQLDHFIRRLVRVAKPGSPITGRHLQTAAEYSLLRPGAKPAAFRSSKNLDPDGHPLANVFNGMGWNDFVAGERWTKGRMMYDAESRGFKPREIVAYLFEREIALRGTDVQLRDASGNPVQGDPGEESGRQALISMLVGQYQRNKKNWVPAYRSQTELAGASS